MADSFGPIGRFPVGRIRTGLSTKLEADPHAKPRMVIEVDPRHDTDAFVHQAVVDFVTWHAAPPADRAAHLCALETWARFSGSDRELQRRLPLIEAVVAAEGHSPLREVGLGVMMASPRTGTAAQLCSTVCANPRPCGDQIGWSERSAAIAALVALAGHPESDAQEVAALMARTAESIAPLVAKQRQNFDDALVAIAKGNGSPTGPFGKVSPPGPDLDVQAASTLRMALRWVKLGQRHARHLMGTGVAPLLQESPQAYFQQRQALIEELRERFARGSRRTAPELLARALGQVDDPAFDAPIAVSKEVSKEVSTLRPHWTGTGVLVPKLPKDVQLARIGFGLSEGIRRAELANDPSRNPYAPGLTQDERRVRFVRSDAEGLVSLLEIAQHLRVPEQIAVHPLHASLIPVLAARGHEAAVDVAVKAFSSLQERNALTAIWGSDPIEEADRLHKALILERERSLFPARVSQSPTRRPHNAVDDSQVTPADTTVAPAEDPTGRSIQTSLVRSRGADAPPRNAELLQRFKSRKGALQLAYLTTLLNIHPRDPERVGNRRDLLLDIIGHLRHEAARIRALRVVVYAGAMQAWPLFQSIAANEIQAHGEALPPLERFHALCALTSCARDEALRPVIVEKLAALRQRFAADEASGTFDPELVDVIRQASADTDILPSRFVERLATWAASPDLDTLVKAEFAVANQSPEEVRHTRNELLTLAEEAVRGRSPTGEASLRALREEFPDVPIVETGDWMREYLQVSRGFDGGAIFFGHTEHIRNIEFHLAHRLATASAEVRASRLGKGGLRWSNLSLPSEDAFIQHSLREAGTALFVAQGALAVELGASDVGDMARPMFDTPLIRFFVEVHRQAQTNGLEAAREYTCGRQRQFAALSPDAIQSWKRHFADFQTAQKVDLALFPLPPPPPPEQKPPPPKPPPDNGITSDQAERLQRLPIVDWRARDYEAAIARLGQLMKIFSGPNDECHQRGRQPPRRLPRLSFIGQLHQLGPERWRLIDALFKYPGGYKTLAWRLGAAEPLPEVDPAKRSEGGQRALDLARSLGQSGFSAATRTLALVDANALNGIETLKMPRGLQEPVQRDMPLSSGRTVALWRPRASPERAAIRAFDAICTLNEQAFDLGDSSQALLLRDLWHLFLPFLNHPEETGPALGSLQELEVLEVLMRLGERLVHQGKLRSQSAQLLLGGGTGGSLMLEFAQEIAKANLLRTNVRKNPYWREPFPLRMDQWDAARRMADAMRAGNGHFILSLSGHIGNTATFLAAAAGVPELSTFMVAAGTTSAVATWFHPSEANPSQPALWMPAATVLLGAEKAVRALEKTPPPGDAPRFLIVPHGQLPSVPFAAGHPLLGDDLHQLRRVSKEEPNHARDAFFRLTETAGAVIGQTSSPIVRDMTEVLTHLELVSGGRDPRFASGGLDSRILDHRLRVWSLAAPHVIYYATDVVLDDVAGRTHADFPRVKPNAKAIEAIRRACARPSQENRLTLYEVARAHIATSLEEVISRAKAEPGRKVVVAAEQVTGGTEYATQRLQDEFGKGCAFHLHGNLSDKERWTGIEAFLSTDSGVDYLVTTQHAARGITPFQAGASTNIPLLAIVEPPRSWGAFDETVGLIQREGHLGPIDILMPIVTYEGVTTLANDPRVPKRSYDERALDSIEETLELVRHSLQGIPEEDPAPV